MEIHLRPARPGDGALMLDVARAAVELTRSHYDAAQVSAWMRDRTPAYYEPDIAAGRTIIAEAAGRTVGFVSSVPGEVTRLFVRPEAAGQGLGARLVQLGIELAATDAPEPVIVQATLNARTFYERHGFRFESEGAYEHGTGGIPVKVANMVLDHAYKPSAPRATAQIMESLT